MSSILLVNPFLTPAPPPQHSTGPDNSNAQSSDAVTPTQNSGAAGASGNATSYSGSGSGQNGGSGTQSQQSQSTLRNDNKAADRPTDATGTSVVNAQTRDDAEKTIRAKAILAQQSAQNSTLFDNFATPRDLPKFADRVARDMPDPLPTSPFLKSVSEKN